MAEVLLTRVQNRLYPILVIGAVGIFLTLQTYTYVLGILDTMLADNVGISTNALEISGINLYTRFIGVHLHEDTCLGRIEAGTYLCVVTLTILKGVQAEIVVIASGILNLVELALDAVTNSMWGAEIHWSSFHRLNLASGDVELVAGCEVVGIDIEYLIVSSL